MKEPVKDFIDSIEAAETPEAFRAICLDAKEGRMKWGKFSDDWGAHDLSGG
jgi:hypothetical protein